jgi:UDP-N-acetylglucosamine 2-epimerase (non-hydrolysing)
MVSGHFEPKRRVPGALGTIVYVYGARPNFVKMAPVIRALRGRLPDTRHVCVHTGQHYDAEMSASILAELLVPEPDYALAVGSGMHGEQTARALERVEHVLVQAEPALVLVAGDVNSTLAAALAAVKLGIPVGHVESGLRSFDWTMPEEINRLLVDQISSWCFTHSPEAEHNLLREGVGAGRIHAVGNTMIDTLVRMQPRLQRSTVHARLGVAAKSYLLVTLHRPALVDGPLLAETLAELEALAYLYPVVFPVHPRTRARLLELGPVGPGVHLIDPVGYVDFLALESYAAGVITDSGGVQEETTYLGVPCFTLRENTERPITVTQGTNRLLGLRVEALREVPELIERAPAPGRPPDGWDGRAAERIAGVLVGDARHVRDAEHALAVAR